jgi:F-type H+-transporting ATPase subunit b
MIGSAFAQEGAEPAPDDSILDSPPAVEDVPAVDGGPLLDEHSEPPGEAHTEVPGEHETPFPPFNPEFFASQIIWLVITFVALYYLMKRVAVPRIAGILEDRRDRIASDLDQAQGLKEQSDEAIAAYEQALAEARGKAQAIAETARDEARAAADAQRAETEKKLAESLAAAEQRIAEIKAKAISDVGEIAAEAAEAVVEMLTAERVSRDDVSGAVAAVMEK